MALRDQPYIPLYVQDFSTDEKLRECAASSVGVYIMIMCLMHKSEEYGKILLKQKDKQDGNQIKNFALKIAKHVPFSFDIILAALNELIDEEVLRIDQDYLYQKRMVEDNDLSITRSLTGKKGGEKTQQNIKKFAKAKNEANAEYEIEDENNNTLPNKVKLNGEKFSKNGDGSTNGSSGKFAAFERLIYSKPETKQD